MNQSISERVSKYSISGTSFSEMVCDLKFSKGHDEISLKHVYNFPVSSLMEYVVMEMTNKS